MSLPFEKALQREREHQRRQREGGQHTDLSAHMDTPTLSPAGVGSPLVPPPLDLSSMTDMVTELTRPVDQAQLDQEIEDFNLSYPVNVDDAVNLFSLLPVAGTGTAPATTTTQPVTTATHTRPDTSTRTRRNITHTNTVTTVYEEGGGRPSVRRTSTRTSSPSPPPSPPCQGRGRGRARGWARGRI